MNKPLWIGVAAASLAVGYLAYSNFKTKPTQAAPARADAKPDSKAEINEALRDASLLDLIKNARVATRKGDEVTRTAMVAGLRKEPARARILIQRERAKTKDETDVAILTRIESELP